MANDRIQIENGNSTFNEFEIVKDIGGTLTTSDKLHFVLRERNQWKLLNVVLATSSGSCTVSVRKNGSGISNLTGLAVTSTPTVFTPTGNITISATDKVDLVVTATSSGIDLAAQCNGQRLK